MFGVVISTLLRPRWIALTLAVVVLVILFVELSGWQWGRREDKVADNQHVTAQQHRSPVPVSTVTQPATPLDADQDYRPVRAQGRYDAEHQVLVRYRSLGEEPGYNVLTPLVTQSGATLLVNRGWIDRGGSSTELPDPPPPPEGTVTVTARMRVSETGSAQEVRPGAADVRYIDVPKIARGVPGPVYGGYAELTDQQPPAGEAAPKPLPLPELDEGPHLSYSVQWLIFAAIAVLGWLFLLVDEVTGGRLRERLRRRTSSEDEDAADEHRRAAAEQAADRASQDKPGAGRSVRGEQPTGNGSIVYTEPSETERSTSRTRTTSATAASTRPWDQHR